MVSNVMPHLMDGGLLCCCIILLRRAGVYICYCSFHEKELHIYINYTSVFFIVNRDLIMKIKYVILLYGMNLNIVIWILRFL